MLKSIIAELKEDLKDKNAPFGVDLLLPQVGGSARKTNKDYTNGQLDALVDIIIEEKAALFVCAVGVPPKHVIDKLHKAGIPVMNMVGAPKHAVKACELGVDLICAQAGEGGGHTGSIPFSLLIPEVVDICRKYKSPLTGGPVQVIAAGRLLVLRTKVQIGPQLTIFSDYRRRIPWIQFGGSFKLRRDWRMGRYSIHLCRRSRSFQEASGGSHGCRL